MDQRLEPEYTVDGIKLPDGTIWPYCAEPGCEFCVCRWANVGLCFRHAVQQFGEAFMKERYEATHSITWEDFMAS